MMGQLRIWVLQIFLLIVTIWKIMQWRMSARIVESPVDNINERTLNHEEILKECAGDSKSFVEILNSSNLEPIAAMDSNK